MQSAIRKTSVKLTVLAVAMFGFGYLMVPLYDVFCEITGINGKTGEISTTDIDSSAVDKSRLVTVEFDTNVNSNLPWSFSAVAHSIKVHPGELSEAIFVAENRSSQLVIGQAIPSVAPPQASLYFNKAECFCFNEQPLQPGERQEMAVRFVVDSELPEKIKTLTLSYTFFNVSKDSQPQVGKIDESQIADLQVVSLNSQK